MPLSLLDSLKDEIPNLDNDAELEPYRAKLKELRSPTLDALRQQIHAIPTSQLLAMMSGHLTLTPEEEALPEAELMAVMNAAVFEIADEIDARLPPRAPKSEKPATLR